MSEAYTQDLQIPATQWLESSVNTIALSIRRNGKARSGRDVELDSRTNKA